MYNKPSVVIPEESESFVQTPYIKELTERALSYLKIGFPVHISGPTGVGKTTLAFHLAAQLCRPSVLICGDYQFQTSDLVGDLYGYHKRFVMDNYIRSVVKTDESLTQNWVDSRLTTACERGLTLIYDEFTRSRPEANNVLLSVFEEGILPLPIARGGKNYIKVHPNFTAILTSNPEEYAGVQKSQDALRDRMVTIELNNFDEETEVAITQAKSGVSPEQAECIVNLIRRVREAKRNQLVPTIRACIVIGRLLKLKEEEAGKDGCLRQICRDILLPGVPIDEREAVCRAIDEAIFLSEGVTYGR